MRKIIKPGSFTNGKKVVQIPDIEFELPPLEEDDDGEFSEITSFPDGTEAVESGRVIAGIQTGDAANQAARALQILIALVVTFMGAVGASSGLSGFFASITATDPTGPVVSIAKMYICTPAPLLLRSP